VCSELQRLFAHMQRGRRPFFSAAKLAEVLDVQLSTHHDVSE
jgi:hypothetical protein